MADINPNISGSTVDPKWIDGGPENPEPTFNIDDPTFSLPMPVMSGLASGFCERAAVVYGGTVGGQPWDNATSAAKANMVSCLAANLALGTVPNASMTNMFVSANTDFMPTRYNTTSNYMKGLDNMLTKLISAPGGYVRNVTGTDPTAFTFTTLANDAKSRSALPSVGSSATSVGSGGASYTSRFLPALPVVYPIHRKWMMDELKYTASGANTTYLHVPGDLAGYMIEANEYTSASTLSGVVSSYIYHTSATKTSQTVGQGGLNYPAYTNIHLDRESSGGAVTYTISAASPVAFGMLANWSGANSIETPLDIYMGAVRADLTDEGVWFIQNYYNSATSSWYDVPFYHSGTSTITVEQPNVVVASSYIVGSSAAVTFTASGVVDVESGTSIGSLDIRSGGTAYIDPGTTTAYKITSVTQCNIASGGSLAILTSGTTTGQRVTGSAYSNVHGGIALYNNYRRMMMFYDGLDQDSYVYESGGTLTNLPMHSGGRYYGLYVFGADAGAVNTTVSLSSSSNDHIMLGALIESGCTLTVTGSNTHIEGDVCVMPGATLVQTSGYISELYITSGATATIGARCEIVYVHSGGEAHFIDNCSIGSLLIDDGANINISGSDIVDGMIKNAEDNNMFGEVSISLYHQLQVSGISSGWNNSKTVSDMGAGNALFAGSAYSTAINTVRASISSAIIGTTATNPMYDITDAAYSGFGSSNIGGTIYSGYAALGQLSSCTVIYGAQALAVYPTDSGGTQIQDHYSSFRVRQFYEDPGKLY